MVVKQALARLAPFSFLAWRFCLAGLFLLAVCRIQVRPQGPGMVSAGIKIGAALFAAYAFQTVGLQYTTPSKAAFITALSVVLVPIMSSALLRQLPGAQAVVGVGLATVGLALLTWEGWSGPGWGDLLVLACAFGFATHIIAVARYSGEYDPLWLTGIQIMTVGILSLPPAMAEGFPLPSRGAAWAVVYTALVATAGAFLIQNAVQQFTTPTHTALIFSTEPVFAAAWAYVLVGDLLESWQVVGAALVLAGTLVSELAHQREGPAEAEPPSIR